MKPTTELLRSATGRGESRLSCCCPATGTCQMGRHSVRDLNETHAKLLIRGQTSATKFEKLQIDRSIQTSGVAAKPEPAECNSACGEPIGEGMFMSPRWLTGARKLSSPSSVDGRCSLEFDRDLDEQRCPVSGVTRDLQCAAKRLDAVHQAGESGTFAHVGSPDSIVSNRKMEVGIVGFAAHLALGGSSRLGRRA